MGGGKLWFQHILQPKQVVLLADVPTSSQSVTSGPNQWGQVQTPNTERKALLSSAAEVPVTSDPTTDPRVRAPGLPTTSTRVFPLRWGALSTLLHGQVLLLLPEPLFLPTPTPRPGTGQAHLHTCSRVSACSCVATCLMRGRLPVTTTSSQRAKGPLSVLRACQAQFLVQSGASGADQWVTPAAAGRAMPPPPPRRSGA